MAGQILGIPGVELDFGDDETTDYVESLIYEGTTTGKTAAETVTQEETAFTKLGGLFGFSYELDDFGQSQRLVIDPVRAGLSGAVTLGLGAYALGVFDKKRR